MPEIEDVHAGLMRALELDPGIKQVAPGGVEFILPRQGTKHAFVLVRLRPQGERVNTHDRGGYERIFYEVLGADLNPSGAPAAAIAKAIRARLEGVGFDAQGYRIAYCEIATTVGPIADVVADGDQRWQLRGRVWEVVAAPTELGTAP